METERTTYLCLWCGYSFLARKLETSNIRQCPRCKSSDLITLKEIKNMADYAKREMQTTILGRIPFVDTCRAIFWEKGLLRYRLLSTINLECMLYKIAKEGKSLEQAINEVFEGRKGRS